MAGPAAAWAMVFLGITAAVAGCADRSPDERGPEPTAAPPGGPVIEDPELRFRPGLWRAWDQMGGGAGHSGYAILSSTTMDVVLAGDLLEKGNYTGFQPSLDAVPTPYGLATYTGRSLCQYGLSADLRTPLRTLVGPGVDCWGVTSNQSASAIIVGYDLANDRVLTCNRGGNSVASAALADEPSPVIQSHVAETGEIAWQRFHDELFPPALAPPPSGADFSVAVECAGGAIDVARNRAIVALYSSDGTANSLAAVDLLTGDVAWATQVFPDEPESSSPLDQSTITSFFPISVTITETGVLVIGLGAETSQGFNLESGTERSTIAWLDHDGNLVGFYSPNFGPTGPREIHSQVAASFGGTAVGALGPDLFYVNPGSSGGPYLVPLETREDVTTGPHRWVAPAWWGDHVVVPFRYTVNAYEPRMSGPRWTWSPWDYEWAILDMLIAPPYDVYVLAHRPDVEGPNGAVFRIDLDRGIEVQRLPLPIRFSEYFQFSGKGGRLLPIEDVGLLVTNRTGDFALIAPAQESGVDARIEADDLYPAPREPVSLRITSLDSPPLSYQVAWGDGNGAVLNASAGSVSVSHTYIRAGFHDVYVTGLRPDGRTSTQHLVVNVGGTPPQRLTPIQTAFEPENQEVTFFFVGLAITLLLAAAAGFGRLRRRSRLSREIEALEEVRERGRDDPTAAFRDLSKLRNAWLHNLRAGRIDDRLYAVLDARVLLLLPILSRRLLGGLAPDASPEFLRALELALADGRLLPLELDGLNRALRRETRLGAPAQRRIRTVLAELANV